MTQITITLVIFTARRIILNVLWYFKSSKVRGYHTKSGNVFLLCKINGNRNHKVPPSK